MANHPITVARESKIRTLIGCQGRNKKSLGELAVDRHVSSSIAESLSDRQVHPKPCEARYPTARRGPSSPRKASLSALRADAPHQSPVELGRTSSFPRHRRLFA